MVNWIAALCTLGAGAFGEPQHDESFVDSRIGNEDAIRNNNDAFAWDRDGVPSHHDNEGSLFQFQNMLDNAEAALRTDGDEYAKDFKDFVAFSPNHGQATLDVPRPSLCDDNAAVVPASPFAAALPSPVKSEPSSDDADAPSMPGVVAPPGRASSQSISSINSNNMEDTSRSNNDPAMRNTPARPVRPSTRPRPIRHRIKSEFPEDVLRLPRSQFRAYVQQAHVSQAELDLLRQNRRRVLNRGYQHSARERTASLAKHGQSVLEEFSSSMQNIVASCFREAPPEAHSTFQREMASTA
jgi:hypothetical protein